MKPPSLKFVIIPAIVAGLLMGAIPAIEEANAKCQWVWRGTQTYLECEDQKTRRDREYICDKTTSRDRKGDPVSITTFCRPDGSVWKKIIVKPHRVAVKTFKHNGSLAWKKRYSSGQYEETRRERARPNVPPKPSSFARVRYMGHFERHGDTGFVSQANILGKPGSRSRLEGYSINLAFNSKPIRLRYMAHVSRMGDTEWVHVGEYCGTRGQGRAVEGIAVDRVGSRWKQNFDVFYRVHIQRHGWTEWRQNGEYCGSKGKGRPVNAIQIFIADR